MPIRDVNASAARNCVIVAQVCSAAQHEDEGEVGVRRTGEPRLIHANKNGRNGGGDVGVQRRVVARSPRIIIVMFFQNLAVDIIH